ncbi:hypothetical protein E1301_Tti022950 [Triplophysa tibetana]|uniref:ribonuclease H n=1 Tax=Triplophysa tibetana TaxID=1572043 RepID=A0A5A9NBM1_9TELE|nr:hypothetical protein E1301_Tti022950 [Triplophysa tibetana]
MGLQILPYLDDWLLCSHTQEQAMMEIGQLLSDITHLGLAVNFSKSKLTPIQSVEFIGIILNSRLMKASPSEQRVNSILLLLPRFRGRTRLLFRYFLRLMGLRAAAAAVIPLGLLGPFQRWVNSFHLNPNVHMKKLIKKLLTWAFPRLASVRVMHITGVTNGLADFLSRHKPLSGEWSLNPEVVELIWQCFGSAEVDLFASAMSAQCPLWFSLAERSSPVWQDALAQDWPDLSL